MRPEEANRLFNDPELKECFSLTRERIHKEWEAETNRDKQHDLWLQLNAIRELYATLQDVLNQHRRETK